MNDLENLMNKVGIPKRYWYAKIAKLTPTSIVWNGIDKTKRGVKREEQKQLVDLLLKADAVPNSRILIMSSPTDEVAMKISARIARWHINGRVKMFDLSRDFNFKREEYEDLCVLYNVSINSPLERLQKARDLVYRINTPLILVAGGGCPREFYREYLHVKMDEVVFYKRDGL